MIILRAEAKAKGLRRYFTGLPCKHGHVSERQTLGGGCMECLRVRKSSAKRYHTNSAYREVVKARTLARHHQLKSDPQYKAARATYNKNWFEANPGKSQALCRARQSAKLQRTPVWMSTEECNEIRGLYVAANLISEMHMAPMHVDHIVPLRGKLVSGLHVLRNLQILPAGVNSRKSNLFNFEDFA